MYCRAAGEANNRNFPMRYFINLAYDGAAYHGWQVQPNAVSVQQKLNEALSTLLRQPILTVGAGRTDAGVNAHCMVAHFDFDTPDRQSLDLPLLTHKMNRLLPPDIAVHSIRPVRDDAHARFSATRRKYVYRVYTRKDPFARHVAAFVPFPLDFERMNEAARILLSTSDFTSFSKLHTDAKTNICRVVQAQWEVHPDGTASFTIAADRFLRNMVRAVVGTLVDVGRGKLSLDEFRAVIAKKDRCSAGDSMPGHALSLVDIAYPDDVYID